MIDNEILQRALEWSDYAKGIRIFLDTDVSSIKNGELREAILLDEKKQGLTPRYYRGRKRKTWYDAGSNSIHVILSNIDNARELDRLILNEILLRTGLDGLVGDTTMNLIANAVFNGQDVQTQKTFLSYVLGRMDSESDHIAAGKLYLRAQANQYAKACTPRSKENAGKAWHSIVNKYIRPFTPKLFSFLSKETSLSQIIGAGIRAHAFYDSSAERMKEISPSSVRDEIIKLYDREMEGRPLDLGRYIHLGRPSDILLACAPWTRTCPVYLPLLSLYENQEDGRFERYITAVDDVKKDKHPFSLLQILHLKEDLDAPLAVFKSIKRDRGLVVMLPSKGGKSASDSEAEHFAVATSLQEINYTEKDGLRKSYGSGKWVNYIHSIYPKHDTGFLCWLSVPGLCSYIDPSFEEKWLKPAEKRLEMYFENLFETEGIKKPSAEEVKTILNTMSADEYIDIKSKLAKFLDLNEAGLPKVYSVYRDILESATKIVKEFENPKIISNDVEFLIDETQEIIPSLPTGEKKVFDFLKRKLGSAGISVTYADESTVNDMIKKQNSLEFLQFASNSKEFSDTLSKAINGKGIVAAGLSNETVRVVKIPKRHYEGDFSDAIHHAREEALYSLAGIHIAHKGTPKQFTYYIPNDFINGKSLSAVAINKSTNKSAHLFLMNVLPEVIENCVDAEIHPDYAKKDGVRTTERLGSLDKLVHRMYGAVEYDGDIYRVLVTMFEYRDARNRPYCYEIKETTLSQSVPATSLEPAPLGNSSPEGSAVISVAKLLNGVYKSYDKDKNLLDESELADKNASALYLNVEKSVRTALGGKILGWASGNKITLTNDGINPYTLLHEYTHVWALAMRLNNTEAWENIKAYLKKSPLWGDVESSKNYERILENEDKIASEVLARLGCYANMQRIEIVAASGKAEDDIVLDKALSELVSELESFWGWTKDLLGIKEYSSLSEITGRILYDIVNSTDLHLDINQINENFEFSIMSKQDGRGKNQHKQKQSMNSIYLTDLERHGIEHFQFEHIMPSRILRGTNDHGVPIHASSKMCDDAGIIGNYNRMGSPVVAIKGKESLSVPPGGVYLVEEGKSNYKLLSKEAFDKRFTMVEVLRENRENTLVCVKAGTKLNFAQTGANRQMFPEHVKDTKIDTLTRDAILAHIDKITALYPQYPQDPTKVSLKPDGSIVRQYGEFEYEQIKGGFERSKNLVLVEELDGETLQRKALYSMSSDSYGEHPNGPYVRFWDNGNIRSYENCSVRVGSDNEFESDMLSFTREGIVQEKIPGDYPIEPFLEDITNEYMKTMTQKEGLEPNATADKIDSALLSTWFISLPLEDKMRVFGYYHNNLEVEESPIGFLKNAMDVEKIEKAYKTAVETPFDIPEVDDTAVKVSLEKELNTAFDSLSDASKEQIYRETVAAGIPGIEPSQSQTVAMQEGIDSTKNAIIVGFAEAYHENQRKISLLDAHLVPGLRRPVLEPWEKLTDIEKAVAIVKAAQTVSLLDREYGLENIINKKVPDTEIIEMIARGGDEAFGRLFINYVDVHVKVRNGVVEIMNKDRLNAAMSVGGSRVYGTLISSLAQAYHEKYKEDGISLVIAATWAQEVAVRIEETIGGANFFYPGRIDVKSLADAIGKEYDENDRQLVLDKLSDMLKPFAAADEITSEFSVTTLRKSILGISEGDGADVLEAYVRQGFGEVSPMSVDEVKNKIETLASECKVVLCLDNSTTEQRPFNDLDVCLDIIGMTGMAGLNDTILVKEKTIAGGTMYTVADSLLLSGGVPVFNACLDKNGDLISYSDANQDVHVCYANAGAVYSVTTQNWGKEGSQPQSETYYTTQLIVDAFERIKKELPNKTLNQLQEQVEILQKIESPLRHFSIKAQSETTPQSLYRVSDMLERFDALKSEVSQQMSKELKRFNNTIHLVVDNAPNMNLFELEGALSKISVVGPRFLEICEKNTGVPDAFNLAKDFKLTLTNLETAVKQAEKDYKQYLERGERTNNTLWDRLLGRTFTPHFALPTKEEIEEFDIATEPMRYVQDSFMLFASSIDPHIDVSSIFNSLLENNQVTVEAAEQEYVAESKSISLGELTSLPLDYKRQLEMTGRIDGPVCLLNPGGEDILVCVQKDGDSLISMRSDDIMSAIDKISSQEEPMFSVNVDGQHYQMRKDNFDSFKYGHGAYAVNAETGEKAYLIFDVKEKKVVKTEKFETVLSKKLQEEKAKADKVIAQSIGQKTETPAQKRGSGMKKS